MYLLDTNVISELRKVGDGRADPAVVAWVSGVDAGEMFISALTLMELEIGILRVERRDPAQGARLRAWVETQVCPEFEDRTLSIDGAIARRCARLHVPDPKSERDALIAATALEHGLRVVTRNMADFAATGVSLINPWQDVAG
ncbi:type II toxin-antitoxin system VapC family toxin [Seohaeicola saemankumensis]|uniref:type II toxin-antitoxin system VapC family toxin n=1 Tax=Seohaeicola TaxID=481178 RepID=UPI0035D0F788